MTYPKSLKSQQVMSPISRLVTCATSQQASQNNAKNRDKKETKAMKTKRRWRKKKRPGKCISNLYTPIATFLQVSKCPYYQKNLSAITKIAKNNSKSPKLYLFFQNF